MIRLQIPFVTITKGLRDLYVNSGMLENNILVSPDAVDLEQFNISISRMDARTKLGLDQGEKIVLYTGHLYSWKGAHTLAEAARLLPEGIKVIFVGGNDADVSSFNKKYADVPNLKILGKKPHADMPIYMRAANLLVIPNSGFEDISRLYTSPMKLFEYMASKTPIIASDLPSIREIVDESMVTFFTPDDPKSLAEVIDKTFIEYSQAEGSALKTFDSVRAYSWKNRARDIIRFIN
jgi:glycosyltransferase involved in cell wall biosynthesis